MSLLRSLLRRITPRKKNMVAQAQLEAPVGNKDPRAATLGKLIDLSAEDYALAMAMRGKKFEEVEILTSANFPKYNTSLETLTPVAVGDAKVSVYAGDNAVALDSSVTGQGEPSVKGMWAAYQVPEVLQQWYSAQSFIGYQACALIAQHWLVDKCCTMPSEDAVRNGYEIAIINEDSKGVQAAKVKGYDNDAILSRIRELDKLYNINDELIQFGRYTEIYGIRVALFVYDSEDPKFYEKPFNIDGVKKGSYKGIKQIDPYWMMPVLSSQESGNPTDIHFYDPSYWVIGGKKYHRSHLIIGRGPQPADILKPNYIFGGIPLTQRIYERVYAAERTANEGPLLAMTKRTSVLHTDLAMAEAQPAKFLARIMKWVGLRDNFGIKTVGIEDSVEQFDTSLADLDSVIMTQYQLVSAIAKTPATKLLGTSPKGFNATGDHETKSYHELLESLQKNRFSVFLERHHKLLCKSEFGEEIALETVWNRVDSFTALELAELNLKKAQAGEIEINIGAISPDDERNRLKNDPLSGYNHISDEQAEVEMGASPENQAELEKAEASTQAATAKEVGVGMPAPGANAAVEEVIPAGADPTMHLLRELRRMVGAVEARPEWLDPESTALLHKLAAMLDTPPGQHALSVDVDLDSIKSLIDGLAALFPGERVGLAPSVARTVKNGVQPSVSRFGIPTADTNQAGLPERGGAQFSHRAMPKIRVGRMTLIIENPKDTIRAGATLAGEEWRSVMPHHYGYIAGTTGADGDEVDAFMGPEQGSRIVYVINQIEPSTGQFDEHKVMFGFTTPEAARGAYEAAFQKGWTGFHSMVQFNDLEEFRQWLRSSDLEQPCGVDLPRDKVVALHSRRATEAGFNGSLEVPNDPIVS